MDEKEIKKLHTQFVKGEISGSDRKRLFDAIREESRPFAGEMTDDEIAHFLSVSHEDYGKPDENGIIMTI